MFDCTLKILSTGDNVKVFKYFDGVIDCFSVDGYGEEIAVITWEMRSGYKYGEFYSEEIFLPVSISHGQ